MIEIDDILKFKQLQFIIDTDTMILTVYLQNWMIISNNEIHNYETRTQNKMYTYKTKQEIGKKCIMHNWPLLLNNIPDIIKTA